MDNALENTMHGLLKAGLGLAIALGAAGCAVVPAYDGYDEPQVTIVAPAPRYYVAPAPRYYVFPGQPYRHHHGDGWRRDRW